MMNVVEAVTLTPLGIASLKNQSVEDFLLNFVRVFHEKLNLVNALFHEPGSYGVNPFERH
jgi:hypothetical protein